MYYNNKSYYYWKKEARASFFSYIMKKIESGGEMKRLDLILIAGVLVLAGIIYLVFLGSAEDGGKAVITVDGQVVQELPLDEDTTYRVETPEGYNIVEIKDGWADVIEADCRDGLCADQKRVHKTGETIVCLPHKMVVTIEAGTENTVDAVVG